MNEGIAPCYKKRIHGNKTEGAGGQAVPFAVIDGPCLVDIVDAVRIDDVGILAGSETYDKAQKEYEDEPGFAHAIGGIRTAASRCSAKKRWYHGQTLSYLFYNNANGSLEDQYIVLRGHPVQGSIWHYVEVSIGKLRRRVNEAGIT